MIWLQLFTVFFVVLFILGWARYCKDKDRRLR